MCDEPGPCGIDRFSIVRTGFVGGDRLVRDELATRRDLAAIRYSETAIAAATVGSPRLSERNYVHSRSDNVHGKVCYAFQI